MDRERTVIVGGGEAGLIAAAHLERASETNVVVVSNSKYHMFSFLLYDVIAGAPLCRARLNLAHAFRGKDVTFVRDVVEGLDTTENRIDLRSGALHFDTLLIALGGVTKYDIDDREHVLDVRTDVREIRNGANAPDIQRIVVVGGGPVGVETTATLSSITDDVDVGLISSSRRLLPDFPQRASRIAERILRRRDVDLRMAAQVTGVTANDVVLDGATELSDLTVWAGGVRPNPVIENFDLARSDRGLRVDSRLRCRGVDDVYAVGDVVDYPGKVTDGYAAGLEARTAAKNVLRELRGRRLKDLDVRWHPRAVYLGEDTALLTINGLVHCGRSPKLLRDLAIALYLFYWRRVY